MHKEQGGDTARRADPKGPMGGPILYGVMLKISTGAKVGWDSLLRNWLAISHHMWAIVLCLTCFLYFIYHYYCCFPFYFCPIKLSLSQHVNVSFFFLPSPPPIPFGRGVGHGGVQVNGCVAFSCLLG